MVYRYEGLRGLTLNSKAQTLIGFKARVWHSWFFRGGFVSSISMSFDTTLRVQVPKSYVSRAQSNYIILRPETSTLSVLGSLLAPPPQVASKHGFGPGA